MLCPFCNTARLDNEAPCPMCGAPSPLTQRTVGGYASQPQQLPFGQPAQDAQPQLSFGQPAQNSQLPSGQSVQNPQSPVSWLPVPYQMPQQDMANDAIQPTSVIPFGWGQGMEERGLVPGAQSQDGASRLPALPDQNDEGAIYIPPMYTKPRPIIPRYRAISGLLSVLIVFLLFCSGAGYYAQASGKIDFLRKVTGMTLPPSMKPTATPTLPDPKSSPDYGPAANIINSASTGSKVDPQYVVLQPENVFRPGQDIYLTYSVQPQKKPGVVTIKWYTNGNLFSPYQSAPIKGGLGTSVQVKFPEPAEGMVELYWNGQLAIRLYFVVR